MARRVALRGTHLEAAAWSEDKRASETIVCAPDGSVGLRLSSRMPAIVERAVHDAYAARYPTGGSCDRPFEVPMRGEVFLFGSESLMDEEIEEEIEGIYDKIRDGVGITPEERIKYERHIRTEAKDCFRELAEFYPTDDGDIARILKNRTHMGGWKCDYRPCTDIPHGDLNRCYPPGEAEHVDTWLLLARGDKVLVREYDAAIRSLLKQNGRDPRRAMSIYCDQFKHHLPAQSYDILSSGFENVRHSLVLQDALDVPVELPLYVISASISVDGVDTDSATGEEMAPPGGVETGCIDMLIDEFMEENDVWVRKAIKRTVRESLKVPKTTS